MVCVLDLPANTHAEHARRIFRDSLSKPVTPVKERADYNTDLEGIKFFFAKHAERGEKTTVFPKNLPQSPITHWEFFLNL